MLREVVGWLAAVCVVAVVVFGVAVGVVVVVEAGERVMGDVGLGMGVLRRRTQNPLSYALVVCPALTSCKGSYLLQILKRFDRPGYYCPKKKKKKR